MHLKFKSLTSFRIGCHLLHGEVCCSLRPSVTEADVLSDHQRVLERHLRRDHQLRRRQVHPLPRLLHGWRLHQGLQRSVAATDAWNVLRRHVDAASRTNDEFHSLRTRALLCKPDRASEVQHQRRLSSTTSGHDWSPVFRCRAHAGAAETGKQSSKIKPCQMISRLEE